MQQLHILLLAGFLGLSGLGLSALLVVQGQARQLRLDQRFATAVAPHLRIRRIDMPRLIRVQPTTRASC